MLWNYRFEHVVVLVDNIDIQIIVKWVLICPIQITP